MPCFYFVPASNLNNPHHVKEGAQNATMVVTAGVGGQATFDATQLTEITAAQGELDRIGESISKQMGELHAMQDAFEKAVLKQTKRLKNLTANTSIKRARSSLAGTPSSEPPPESGGMSVGEYDIKIADLRHRLRKNELLMPATGGMFVEMFLGSINVRFERKSERMNFKREYEKLKLKLAPVFVVMCIICLIYSEYRWLHMMLQMALACYYVTLAVRENILRANGSNIRAWWIIHHYFTMMQGVLLLTWPDGESYARYRRMLHLFGLYNATLMIFQTRYQMARLYTLRSLGMAHEMDVASSDSTQIHWSETMTLLLPIIVFGQFMQGYQATYLFLVYREFPKELQILLLSLLFVANFIGNSTTTVQVLLAKRAERRRKLGATESRQEKQE